MKTSALNNQGEGLVYRGGMVFRRDSDGTLRFESAPFTAGRMTADGVRYHVTDHLGSVRAVIDGSTGDILEASEYSSYGGRTDLTSTVQSLWDSNPSSSLPANRYHFSGKEDQEVDFNAPYTDFGARQYSPSLRRWMVPDPSGEKYYDISPYVYCAGDPVNLIDPKGRDIWIGQYKYEGGILFLGSEQVNEEELDSFTHEALTALHTISSTMVGKTLISNLEESEYTFVIQASTKSSFQQDNTQGAYAMARMLENGIFPPNGEFGSGGTIYWNPDGQLLPTMDGFQSNSTTDLAHELFHADDANFGLLDNRYYKGVKKSEWQAVYYENMLRLEMELPLRSHYRSAVDKNGNRLYGTGPAMVNRRKPIHPQWYLQGDTTKR